MDRISQRKCWVPEGEVVFPVDNTQCSPEHIWHFYRSDLITDQHHKALWRHSNSSKIGSKVNFHQMEHIANEYIPPPCHSPFPYMHLFDLFEYISLTQFSLYRMSYFPVISMSSWINYQTLWSFTFKLKMRTFFKKHCKFGEILLADCKIFFKIF